MTIKTRQDLISTIRFKKGDGRVLTSSEIGAIEGFKPALKKYLAVGTADKSFDTVMFLKNNRAAVLECFAQAFEKGFYGRNRELTVGLLRYHVALGKDTVRKQVQEQFLGVAKPETIQWLANKYDGFVDRLQENIVSPPGQRR